MNNPICPICHNDIQKYHDKAHSACGQIIHTLCFSTHLFGCAGCKSALADGYNKQHLLVCAHLHQVGVPMSNGKVAICSECGEFTISTDESHTLAIFRLTTEEQVKAAAAYVKFLRQQADQ